jgi:hypothetical protein
MDEGLAERAAELEAAAHRIGELEPEALERAKLIVEEAQETADRRLEEARLEAAREKQAMDEGLAERAAELEAAREEQVRDEGLAERAAELDASDPFPRRDGVLGRSTFREAGQHARRRHPLTLVGFAKALVIGLLIAEILYLLIPYSR